MKAWGYALLLAAVVTSADAAAQTSPVVVRGRVIDEQTRTPVSIVVVQLVDTAGRRIVTAVTNEDGRFQLSAPPSGSYKLLRAERLGYFTREMNLPRSDLAGQSVELLLSPRPIFLDSVLVRARPARPLRVTEQLLHGRLVDDKSRTPIRSGTIELFRDGRKLATVTTDDYGLFRLVTPTPGSYTVRASAIGYRTAESPPLRTMLGDTIRFNFNLLPDAVLLAPIVVIASARNILDRSDQTGMEELYNRMARFRGFGQFMTRDSIAAMAELGYTTQHVMTHIFNAGMDDLRRQSGRCAGSLMYLNGAPYVGSVPATQMFGLHALEAIEYYRRPTIPAELMVGRGEGGFGGRMPCTVIVLWTRR